MVNLMCAACGKEAQGNYAMHIYEVGVGPEKDLCDNCGSEETPTYQELYEMIRERRVEERYERLVPRWKKLQR